MVQQTLNLSPETIVDFARWVQGIMPYSGRSISAIFKLTYHRKLYCFGPCGFSATGPKKQKFCSAFLKKRPLS
jgi:hypothetical protein